MPVLEQRACAVTEQFVGAVDQLVPEVAAGQLDPHLAETSDVQGITLIATRDCPLFTEGQ